MMQLRNLKYRKFYNKAVTDGEHSQRFRNWESTIGHKADRCRVCGCQNSSGIGLQIRVAEDSDGTYILPMCSVHSSMPDMFRFQAWNLDLVRTEINLYDGDRLIESDTIRIQARPVCGVSGR